VERSWYNRFKHVSADIAATINVVADGQIFPASRWEIYDPDADYGSYVSLLSKTMLTYRKLHRIDYSY
jgi:protein FAM50